MADFSNVEDEAQQTLIRYLQDLPNADAPTDGGPLPLHSGILPNSKSASDKPRLLLMGQRRHVILTITSYLY
jgi:Ras-related GTP-binding protein C/D